MIPELPSLDYESLRKDLVRFIRDEFHRTGTARGILGLSGGLDSALVAYLAVEALGADQVSAVAMPYRDSSPESLADARRVAEATQLDFSVREITPMVDPYFADQPEASALRRGNKMARERMSILYDLSAVQGALVLGTSNKSEICLGYGTAFGDLACAINPIGDLYKTHVRGLSRHLGVPAEILSKAPSADLWAGQSDEEELGFGYDEVDPLLFRMVDEKWDRQALVEAGWSADFVDRVDHMFHSSEFKRRMPLIADLSSHRADRHSG
jgi:NAD+ synthase